MRKLDRIGITQIRKRKYALESSSDNADSFYLRKVVDKAINENSISQRNDIMNFFSETCYSKDNSNKYYHHCLLILEKLDDIHSPYLQESLSTVCEQLVPRLDSFNLNNFNEEVNKSNLSQDVYDKLQESIDICGVCDVIINNDNTFHKRFKVDDYMKECYYYPLRRNVNEICTLIDTYKATSHIKMSIALDEINYLYELNGINLDRSELVECVLDYFLLRNTKIDNATLKAYQEVLSENVCITDEDLCRIRYFMNEDFVDNTTAVVNDNPTPYDIASIDADTLVKKTASNKVIDMLNVLKISNDKSIEVLTTFAGSIARVDEKQLISAFKEVLNFITNAVVLHTYTIEEARSFFIAFLKNLKISVESTRVLLQTMNNTIDLIDKTPEKYSDDTESIEKYSDLLKRVATSMQEYIEVYTDGDDVKKNIGIKESNDEGLYTLESYIDTNMEYMASINSLIKEEFYNNNNPDAIKIHEMTDVLLFSEKNFIDVCNGKDSCLDCLTEDGIFDHTIAILDIRHPDYKDTIFESVENFCKFINSRIQNETSHLYYTRLDSIIELHLEDTNVIDLTESQQIERDNCFTEAEYTYFGLLQSLGESREVYANMDDINIIEKFDQIQDTMNSDNICSIIELSKYMGGVLPIHTIQTIAENYRDTHPTDYYGNNVIAQNLQDWKAYDLPMDVVTEAVELFNNVLINEVDTKVKTTNIDSKKKKEDGDAGKDRSDLGNGVNKVGDKSKEHKEVPSNSKNDGSQSDTVKDEKKEKPEKEKITFDTIKFAMIGLRKKAQKLNTKAKELSKNIDMNANRFMKAVKDLYTNDNRESVIRGSVIPSFHKLMTQALIGAVGSGVVALFNPIAAVTTAAIYIFSLIAISKHNTNKERALLLDEIDIDLKVIERELQRAENSGSSKKYRILLAQKKKLERERSRIRYNIQYKNMVTGELPDKDD